MHGLEALGPLAASHHEEVEGHQEAGGDSHQDRHDLSLVAEDSYDTQDERQGHTGKDGQPSKG